MSDRIEIDKETAAQMTEYIELTDDILNKQAAEIKQLKEEGNTAEKQAAEGEEAQPVLNEEKVATTVDGLIEAGFAKEGEREDLIKHLQEPENLLGAIDKIAALRAKPAGTMPRMGKVASTGTAPAEKRESDTTFERQFG